MTATLWKAGDPLVLASTSATRRDLLQAVGLPVETIGACIDERAIEASLQDFAPDRIALELAKAKGAEVSARCPGRWVIAADQTLAFGSENFHKPESREQARAQLMKLAGKRHHLHSAVVCFRDGALRFEHLQSAHLDMRDLGPAFLDAYLDAAGDAVTKSVGAYQAEGLGMHLFKRIEGDHSTILGLPLLPLLAFLRAENLVEA